MEIALANEVLPATTSTTLEPPPARPVSVWRQAVDAMSAHVAIVDASGAILAVNEAWRAFAREAGAPSDLIGANYLDVCDTADDPVAAQVACGLRQLLAGERDLFEVVYPCHSPSEQLWFLLRATREVGVVPARLVLIHENVTERQHELERARNRLLAVTDSMGEGMYTLDLDGRLTYMNRAAEALLGWSMTDLAGHVMHDVTHFRHPSGTRQPIDACPMSAARRGETTVRVEDDIFIRADGSELAVAYTATPLRTDQGIEGCVVVFEDITERKAQAERLKLRVDELEWVARIHAALDRDDFVLYEQPIVDVVTGAMIIRELLIRMRDREHPGRVIAPGAFLPVAEQHGLIPEIDRWVIDQATRLAARGMSVEVNVSGVSIAGSWLVPYVAERIVGAGADPAKLVFEITETALVRADLEGRRFVEEIHAMGCRVALDDFGAGYSGFKYLKHLPIDYLKIDIEFIRDLTVDPASRKVVEAIVNLGQKFDLTTVAEGVEDAATLDLLVHLGVDYAQGYHLGRPAPIADPPCDRDIDEVIA